MSAFSDHAEGLTLDWVFGIGTPARPTAWWIRLHTGAPGDDGTANSAAAAIDDTQYSGGWGRSGDTVDNDAEWESAANGGASQAITHVSIWDADPGGGGTPNCLYQGPLGGTVNVAGGATFRFPAGDLNITHA